MSDLIKIGGPDVIRNKDNILWLRKEIERLGAALKEIRDHPEEDGVADSMEAIARAALEGGDEQ